MRRAVLGGLLVGSLAATPPVAADAIQLRHRTLAISAGAVYVEEAGRGKPPLVFVHGLAGSTRTWSPQLVHFARLTRVVAYDWRGHGRSAEPGDADYGFAALAGDLAAVLDALEIKKAVLVGFSFGGAVISTYAGRHPKRVAGLVYLDGLGDMTAAPRESYEDWIAQNLTEQRYPLFREEWFAPSLQGAQPTTREAALQSLRATPLAAVRGTWRDAPSYDPRRSLAGYRGPILVLYSSLNDRATSLQRILPNVQALAVAETSHWIMLDQPAQTNAAIEAFWRRVR